MSLPVPGNDKRHPRLSRLRSGALLLLLMGLVSVVGFSCLSTWKGPAGSLTNDLFVPSILLNAGLGFSNADADTVPGLRDFLDFKSTAFSLENIKAGTTFQPLHPYQEFHRYLLYTLALVWYCFGINWISVKLLLIALLVLSALLTYGISRLVLNRLLSFLVALSFSASAGVYWTLPVLRDFAKVPFILALLLLMGLFIRRRMTPRLYWLLALSAGAVMGIGMGFRRDLLVFLPPVLFFIAAARLQHTSPSALFQRAGALLLAFGAFVLAGLPVHLSLCRDGYVAAHDTLMGFATYSDQELALLRSGSYEKHALLNDLFSTYKAYDAAKRGVTFRKGVYEERLSDPHFDLEMKSAYARKIMLTFPADMLLRAYASVLRINTGSAPAPYYPLRLIEKYGFLFLIVALLLSSAVKPRQTFLLLLLVLYCCGITSLQFGVRHSVHLAFLPYFFAAMTIQLMISAAVQFRKIRCGNASFPSFTAVLRRRWHYVPVLLLLLLLFWLPVKISGMLQERQFRPLLRHYEAQESRPLRYIARQWDDRMIFMPLRDRVHEKSESFHLIDHVSTSFLEARFQQVREPLDIRFVYEADQDFWDFSAPLACEVAEDALPCALRLFFPVPELKGEDAASHFTGLSLPMSQRQYFAGFQEIETPETGELLMPVLIPEKEGSFLFRQRLELPWAGTWWRQYPKEDVFDAAIAKEGIKHAIMTGRAEEAVEKAQDALSHRPDSPAFSLLYMEALEESGRAQDARMVAQHLLRSFPGARALYARLGSFYATRGGADRQRQEWQCLPAQLADRRFEDEFCYLTARPQQE